MINRKYMRGTRLTDMTNSEIVSLYFSNFDGLDSEDMKSKAAGLFKQLYQRKLSHIMPKERKSNGFWSNKTNRQLITYYKKNCSNLSPDELNKEEPGLINVIYKRDLGHILKRTYKPRGFWRDKANKELLEIYNRQYKDLSPRELEKKNSSFYQVLRVRRLVKHLPHKKRPNGFWKSMSNKDLINYCRKNHLGQTRTELQRRGGASGLLQELYARGLDDIVKSKRNMLPRGFWTSKTDEQVLAIYKEKYDGLSPKELAGKDLGLCNELRRRKLANIMPRKKPGYISMSDDELISLYFSNFPNVGSSKLQKKAQTLVSELRKRKLTYILHKTRPDYSSMTNERLMELYRKNHFGLSPSELSKNAKGLYQVLWERDLHHMLPRKKLGFRVKPDKELIELYHKKYANLSYGELVKKPLGQALYVELRRRKLTHILSKGQKPHGFWSKKTDKEIMEYYNKNCTGWSLTKVIEKEACLYDQLRKRGLTINIPRLRAPTIEKAFSNEGVKSLLQLSASAQNGYLTDAIPVLESMFPNLKGAFERGRTDVESLRSYLGEFKLDSENIGASYDVLVLKIQPDAVKSKPLEDLLFKIARDTYQKQFNTSPNGTLIKIKEQASKVDQSYVKGVLQKVHKFYSSIDKLKIPGVENV